MKTLILVTARLGSTRLKRKHLLPAGGKPILQYLVDTINREFTREISSGDINVVIATSELPENRAFKESIAGCSVFAGSDEIIPLRHLEAAEHYEADAILSVDGDDILCSPRAMRSVFSVLRAGASFVKTEGLPLGMNVSGYSVETLRRALSNCEHLSKLETGWGRIFDGITPQILCFQSSATPSMRFTLDYEEDYCFFQTLLKHPLIATGLADEEFIVQYVLSNSLDSITQPITDEYWRRFYANITKEQCK